MMHALSNRPDMRRKFLTMKKSTRLRRVGVQGILVLLRIHGLLAHVYSGRSGACLAGISLVEELAFMTHKTAGTWVWTGVRAEVGASNYCCRRPRRHCEHVVHPSHPRSRHYTVGKTVFHRNLQSAGASKKYYT